MMPPPGAQARVTSNDAGGFRDCTIGAVQAGPIALASSYGLPGREVERAHERGLRFYFWGALRRADFGAALRRLARRDRSGMTIAIQTYARRPWLLAPSIDLARLRLGVDAIDVLGLAFWSAPPPTSIVLEALRLRERGIVRSVVVSSHDRRTLTALADGGALACDGIMARYNAAHLGAEEDVFPAALAARTPVLAYTATRWGSLLAAPPWGERAPTATDCYRFVLSHPAVTACLAGPKDAAELDGVLAAQSNGPMEDDELAWMRRIGAEARARGRVRAPLGPRGVWAHAKGILRELRERGITEDILSRFNR